MVKKARSSEEIATDFGKAVRKTDFDYTIIGGVAIGAWGRPRATVDIDCLLKASKEPYALIKALREYGFRFDEEDIIEISRGEHERLSVFPENEMGVYRVDCKIAKTQDEINQIRDSIDLDYPSGILKVPPPEDVIVYKIKNGGPTTKSDVKSILEISGDRIDKEKLFKLANSLGILDELQDIINE